MMASKSAALAGSAAGKKRQAALELSPALEETIRKATDGLTPQELKSLAPPPPAAAPATPSPAAAPTSAALVQRVVDIHRELTSQGFSADAVERALSALPLHSIALGSALDWLLLHLDRADLPKQYADQVQAGGEVELRHRAAAEDAAAHKVDADADAAAAEAERAKKEAEAAAAKASAAVAAEEAKKKKEEEEERERAARRAWILQYADDSSDEESTGSEDSQASQDSVIEDWEVWGDPREVERRRAERARGALPLEDRLQLIAEELARTMEGAAAAKASGNKAEQRTYGQMIGQLKKEMAELGVTEADLPPVGGSQDAGGAADKTNDAVPMSTLAQDAENEGPAAAGPATAAASGSEDEDEGPGFDFDLFDGGGAVESLEIVPGVDARARRRAKAMAAAALQPWGDTGSSGKKKGGKAAAEPKGPVLQHPKALLQQACQRLGLGAPRYERLPPGGGRDVADGGGDIRYSVTVDPGAVAAGKKKSKSAKLQAKRTWVAPESDDGWARIEDAQGAAATLCLLCLCGEEEPELWRQMPMPFSELWLAWEEEGRGEEAEESENAVAERADFAAALVAEKLAAEAAEAAALEVEAAEEAEEVPWAESLRRRLAARQRNPRAVAAEAAASERLLTQLREFRASSEGAKWSAARGKLPAAALRPRLEEALAAGDVAIVSGETGSGKTTQVPQFLLEIETEAGRGGSCSIVCTQPRRIAAISVAERVASERGEPAPGARGAAVGYSVRLDSATSADTRLLFCTTGVLLRRLAADPALADVTHVVVDEVHERTLQGDFLIALLRDLISHRRAAGLPLKVVLMSATLDSEILSTYFGAGTPTLHAPGRTFPVEHLFLEDAMEATGYVLAPDAPAARRPGGGRRSAQNRLVNAAGARNRAVVRAGWGDDEGDEILNPSYDEALYESYSPNVRRSLARLDEDRIDFDLLEDLVGYIHETHDEGAILVFLPGMAEISNLARRLAGSRRFASAWIVPLHSTVAPADQRRAFKVPHKGTRKIVIATNIAETSLTIEDVTVVVDSGKLKERRHDPARSMSLLVEDWVSVASAKQRRGRAGRVREGICYGLYTRDRFERKMRPYQTPEMARVPLEELVLQVHLLRVAPSAAAFAARTLQPPPSKAVDGALRVLREVGALTVNETLTPLGHCLAQLPVDARVGKLLLLAASLGCLAPALTIAACLSHKPPFATGLAAADGAERAQTALTAPESGTIAAGQQSDHLVMAAAVDGWAAARRKGGARAAAEFARKYALVEQTLDMLTDMRGQFAAMLADIGFLAADRSGGGGGGGNGGRGWFDDPSLRCNRYAKHPAVLKAVLLAALYPNVAVMDETTAADGTRRLGWHDGTGAVAIHPSSVCAGVDAARFQRPFVTYLEKVRTSQVFLRDCTVASPAALLLFGGSLDVDHAAGRVTIDGWLRVRAPGRVAALVGRLRAALEAALAAKVATPRADVLGEGRGAAVVAAIADLLNYEEAAQGWDK